jgi:hypothetical protein
VHGVDYYELLGVRREASPTEIKSAYRTLAKTMHPDAGGTSGTFRLLQQAYETLNDPAARAHYDRGAVVKSAPPTPKASPPSTAPFRPPGSRSSRTRDFGEDPDFVPSAPDLGPDEILWWSLVDPAERVQYVPAVRPQPATSLGIAASWALWLLVGVIVSLPPVLLTAWLVVVLAGGGLVLVLLRRTVLAYRNDRLFTEEFDEQRVFGELAADDEPEGKRITEALMSEHLGRIPGVRIFHGLSWPGSVFADVHHAVLCGQRLVLVESQSWLPGHYSMGQDGTLWRNGHRFRGGATRLAEGVEAYRKWVPGIEVRGVVVVYPSRAGEITTEDDARYPVLPMTPEQFVNEIGAWFILDPATVDRDVFRAVLNRVVD